MPLLFSGCILFLCCRSRQRSSAICGVNRLFFMFLCVVGILWFFHFCRFMSSEKTLICVDILLAFFLISRRILLSGSYIFRHFFIGISFSFFCVAQIWRIGTEYLGGQSAFSYWVINWRYNVYTFILLITPRKDTHRWKKTKSFPLSNIYINVNINIKRKPLLLFFLFLESVSVKAI